jgi:hypothetical protein
MNASHLRQYLPLGLALLTAAILQSALILRTPTICADGIIFTSIARDLSADPLGTFRDQDQHPGYPAAMLAATRLAQWLGYRDEPESWMLGGRAVAYVCGVLSVAVVWCFVRDLYDASVANIAAFVFAVLPLARNSASDAQSDTPHLLFYLLAAWLATLGLKTGLCVPLAIAGLASAVAYWIRPEGLEVFLVAMLFVAWRAASRQWDWGHAGRAAATLATSTLPVAAPYAILAGKITSKQLPLFKKHAAPSYLEKMAVAEAPPTPAAPHAAAMPAPVPPQKVAPPAQRRSGRQPHCPSWRRH